jgi:cytochrome c oxidase cbb3-type subunit 3
MFEAIRRHSRLVGRGISATRYAPLVVAVLLAGLCVAGGLDAAHRESVRTRLLMADPDTIWKQPALQRYAVSAGRSAYRDRCASCHGANLGGDSRRGIADLAHGRWLYGSGRVAELEHTILYGIRSGNPKSWNLASMPAFATPNPYAAYTMTPLTPGELEDVAAYVYGFRHAPTDFAAEERGSRVFHKNGFCFDCHGQDGKGDPAIGAPDLTDSIWLYGDGSMQSIASSIAHGRAGACPPWIDRLPAATIRAIAVFVNDFSGAGRTAAGNGSRGT